jgi:hypothetical protein
MKRILESGRFSNYMNQTRLDSATTEISKSYYPRTTVFISHKHDKCFCYHRATYEKLSLFIM